MGRGKLRRRLLGDFRREREHAQPVAVGVQRHERAAEIHVGGRLQEARPRRLQSRWRRFTGVGVGQAETDLRAAARPAGPAPRAWRDHRPSFRPVSSAKRAKVGERSMGERASSAL
ncbi:hypothetical protein AD428_22675 [Achromobacter sp. DMS1]|nr:hypothetical protein AD428_22675 [Achromobacter sp. DMS1]